MRALGTEDVGAASAAAPLGPGSGQLGWASPLSVDKGGVRGHLCC